MNNPDPLLYLSSHTLKELDVATGEAIEIIEHLIRGRAQSRVWNAPKSVLQPGDGRYMMATLSAADQPPFMAVKSLILNPANPDSGLAQINSLVTLLDSTTGVPVAVMDGNWVTAVRTAGLSAVAARRLARQDSASVAFIGCGVQARSHLDAFHALFPLREIRAFGRGRANLNGLCRYAEQLGLSAIASPTPRDAVQSADLVVSTVTYSADLEPFVDARWLKPGAFATITDIAAPWVVEGMPAFDRIFIDDLEQEASMPDPLVDPTLVSGDLTGLVEDIVPGRRDDVERTAFAFRALALADLALAALAYQRARELSRGVRLER